METQCVLGISSEHDAGIALLENGRCVWATNEERYTRKKFQPGLPKLALDKLNEELIHQRKRLSSTVAVASRFHVWADLGEWDDRNQKYELLEAVFSFTHLDRMLWGTWLGSYIIELVARIQMGPRRLELSRILKRHGVSSPNYYFIDHHTCHAASAYYGSGWDDCMVISQDASGDAMCSKVFLCRNGKMREVRAVPFFHSPGYYYAYITLLFGFKIGREGKVSGLAAYGDPTRTYPIFEKEMSYDSKKFQYINHGYYRNAEMRRLKAKLAGYPREDVAAGIQKHIEIMMTRYVSDMIRLYAKNKPVKLAVAGGVFANVRLNQKVAALSGVKSLYVYPHMGDGGLATGAAMYVSHLNKIKPKQMPHVYLGDAPTQKDILETLRLYKDKIIVRKPVDASKVAATLLAKGRIVAVVRGNMEYGPRALGHRTLLSQATDVTINDWFNKRLRRSEFMPFAPVLRKEDLGRYFTNWKKVLPSLPYMTVTVDCNARCKKEAPAIVHVDGSARPQIVTKESDRFMYSVLTEYAKLTGLRILINTSFNIHEEPIVRTPDDAVKTFIDGSIDALILENYLVTHRR